MSVNDGQHPRDHESDPAHTPGDGWGEEGGASHLGPATHLQEGRHAAHRSDDTEREESAQGSGDQHPDSGNG